jgi:hypothetical protein
MEKFKKESAGLKYIKMKKKNKYLYWIIGIALIIAVILIVSQNQTPKVISPECQREATCQNYNSAYHYCLTTSYYMGGNAVIGDTLCAERCISPFNATVC